jgi:hypothetical protein
MSRRGQPISVHFVFKNGIPAAPFNECSEILCDDGCFKPMEVLPRLF